MLLFEIDIIGFYLFMVYYMGMMGVGDANERT